MSPAVESVLCQRARGVYRGCDNTRGATAAAAAAPQKSSQAPFVVRDDDDDDATLAGGGESSSSYSRLLQPSRDASSPHIKSLTPIQSNCKQQEIVTVENSRGFQCQQTRLALTSHRAQHDRSPTELMPLVSLLSGPINRCRAAGGRAAAISRRTLVHCTHVHRKNSTRIKNRILP